MRRLGLALADVRDLREFHDPVSAEELEQFETDVLSEFVLARASAETGGRHGPWGRRAPGSDAGLVR